MQTNQKATTPRVRIVPRTASFDPKKPFAASVIPTSPRKWATIAPTNPSGRLPQRRQPHSDSVANPPWMRQTMNRSLMNPLNPYQGIAPKSPSA